MGNPTRGKRGTSSITHSVTLTFAVIFLIPWVNPSTHYGSGNNFREKSHGWHKINVEIEIKTRFLMRWHNFCSHCLMQKNENSANRRRNFLQNELKEPMSSLSGKISTSLAVSTIKTRNSQENCELVRLHNHSDQHFTPIFIRVFDAFHRRPKKSVAGMLNQPHFTCVQTSKRIGFAELTEKSMRI